uniref:Guanylate-binding protein, N-terminal domain containing protein, putative n=1 Tax=Theileria annulata TaxID=5874 RepID=A0A3B0N1V2_THEAN
MQLIIKSVVLPVILLLQSLNTNVAYIVINGFLLSSNFVKCNKVENDSLDVNSQLNLEILSQKSTLHTQTVDSNVLNKTNTKYTPNNKNTKQNNYEDILCFSDELELGEPLQLVYPNDDHTELLVDPEVLNHLKTIPGPIYPVAVVGSFNSGKSFLLNLINDNVLCKSGLIEDLESSKSNWHNLKFSNILSPEICSKIFKVSKTPEPETLGIWVYSKPLKITRSRLQEKLQNYHEAENIDKYSLKTKKPRESDYQHTKLSRNKSDPYEDEALSETVNVLLFDVEGFNSHKNIFRYDEAIFSIVSLISSEIVYLSPRTLNSSDLLLMEDLIKCSLQSKISNLYKIYTGLEGFEHEKEEIFQYFFKMFENKNLTFLINEFKFTPEQALSNLVNLLRAPRRDLPLHEFFFYKNQKINIGNYDFRADFVKRIKHKVDKDESPKDKLPVKRDYSPTKDDQQTIASSNKNVCSTDSPEQIDVKFSRFGYIFHMMFNSVNISTLPSTSSGIFSKIFDTDETKTPKDNETNTFDKYFERLGHFKFELFLRALRNPLLKHCSVDESTSTCHMSGRDLAEIVNFSMKILSMNKFYKLATNLTSNEWIKITENDAFDRLVKVLRLSRLLMIQNDLSHNYKDILMKFITGKKYHIDLENLEENMDDGQKNKSELIVRSPIPSMSLFEKYSFKLRNEFLELLLKTFENEGLSTDFKDAWSSLASEFDSFSEEASEKLSETIKEHCGRVSEEVFGVLDDKVEQVRLPALPSKLKFLHFFKDEFKRRFILLVDSEETEFEDTETQTYDKLVETKKEHSLFYDSVCESVFSDYLNKLDEKISELLNTNQKMIDHHFSSVYNKALNHFRSNFSRVDENYELPIEEPLSRSTTLIKEAQNILMTNLGEFHALEFLVSEVKNKLNMALNQEMEVFKTNYHKRCHQKLDNMQNHYLNNYAVFLNSFAPLPTSPELIHMYHEFLKHVSKEELFRVYCTDYMDIDKRHNKLEQKLNDKLKEMLAENVKIASEALEPDFQLFDKYLLTQVNNSRFYNVFRYNAKKYASYKITPKFVYTKLNLGLDQLSLKCPIEDLGLKVLYSQESRRILPRKGPTTPKHGFNSGFTSDSYRMGLGINPGTESDFNFEDLRAKFIRMNRTNIHYKFVDGIVGRYMDTHMLEFKKMFLNNHCKAIVLVCSIILLGLSTLSFSLAQKGFDRLLFAILGFASYSFLVGMETTKRNLRRFLEFLKRVLKKVMLAFLKVLKRLLNKLFALLAAYITKLFVKLGFMYTFLIGFLSAATLYVYSKYVSYRRKKSQEYCNIKVPTKLLKNLT